MILLISAPTSSHNSTATFFLLSVSKLKMVKYYKGKINIPFLFSPYPNYRLKYVKYTEAKLTLAIIFILKFPIKTKQKVSRENIKILGK